MPVINLLQLEKDEKVRSIIQVSPDEKVENLLFVTKYGLVKRTAVSEFENIRAGGKICITLKEGDELLTVRKTLGNNYVLLGSSSGRMVKFKEN